MGIIQPIGMYFPSSAIVANTVLLMHFDGANGSTNFVDEKGHTITPGSPAAISTTQSKFGGASGYFPAPNTTLSIAASADWTFRFNPFTIEYWFYPTTIGDTFTRTLLWSEYTSQWQINCLANSSVLAFNGLGISVNLLTRNFVVNQWQHIAVCRQESQVWFFINGVGTTATGAATYDVQNLGFIGLGHAGRGASYYWDEMRIISGSALYTSDFTPPSAPFTL